MRFWILFVPLLLCVAALSFSGEPAGSAAPPAALDNFFPPKAPGPVFMLKMLEMNSALSGVVIDLFEGDFENVKVHFTAFQQKYAELSKLVPEWESNFDLGAVSELGTALESGDQSKVMGAFGKVGATCHACHTANMAAVQQKYHWDDFSQINATDPVTNETVDFARLMQQIALSFDGIETDLKEGQADRAVKHYEDFAKRFQAMKETCSACHETERKYYVDAGVEAMISQLGTALKSPTPDGAAIGQLGMGIGMESCHKCHLVHVPASTAQMRWASPSQAGHK